MPTELTEIENLANETFNAFFNASEEDKTAMRPAFLAANDAMLKEALGDFHNATGRFTDLSVKLLAAIEAVGSPETRDRLERVFDRLGNVQQVVHGREGMRKTWLNAAEEAEGRSDDEDVPPAEERQPIPKPGIVSPAAVPPTPVTYRWRWRYLPRAAATMRSRQCGRRVRRGQRQPQHRWRPIHQCGLPDILR